MTYELIYHSGGHGGPYDSIASAIDGATRYALGLPNTNTVEIHKRTSEIFSRQTRLGRVVVNRQENTLSVDVWRFGGFDNISRRELDIETESGYTGEAIELFTTSELAELLSNTM